jgi:hypothetical protein
MLTLINNTTIANTQTELGKLKLGSRETGNAKYHHQLITKNQEMSML